MASLGLVTETLRPKLSLQTAIWIIFFTKAKCVPISTLDKYGFDFFPYLPTQLTQFFSETHPL